jgi:hypothetical protein
MENVLPATVRSIDPQLPLNHVQSMEYTITSSEAPRRFNTVLISSFAARAVLLAVLGIYSVIAFSIATHRVGKGVRRPFALGSIRFPCEVPQGSCIEVRNARSRVSSMSLLAL